MIVHGGASLAGNDSLDAARDALRRVDIEPFASHRPANP